MGGNHYFVGETFYWNEAPQPARRKARTRPEGVLEKGCSVGKENPRSGRQTRGSGRTLFRKTGIAQ